VGQRRTAALAKKGLGTSWLASARTYSGSQAKIPEQEPMLWDEI